MRKILHFASQRERYNCDAAVVWCYDNRFEAALRKLLKRLNILRPDPLRVAGGAKSLISPTYEGDRQFLLDQIRKSMQFHGTRTVLLMLHSDCGAYGGLAAFGNDPSKEAQNHNHDLKIARDVVKKAFPELTVRSFFVDFESIWELDEDDLNLDLKTGQTSGVNYV
jgi:carbonic anhydrase